MHLVQRFLKNQRGYTLTELSIALTISAILFIALIALFTANLKHHEITINTNRLNEQLEASIEIMTNEIRRAGYWLNASNDLGSSQNNNPFMAAGTDITINGSCILFTYDRNQSGALVPISASSNDDRVGFRLSSEAIQSRPYGAPFDCNTANSNWENITDPSIVKVTQLSFTFTTQNITTGSRSLAIRGVNISLTGQLVNDTSITRTITQYVRIRNDKFS